MIHMVISYIGCICSLFFQLLPLFEISEGIKLQELCACVHWELQHCKVCIPTLTDALNKEYYQGFLYALFHSDAKGLPQCGREWQHSGRGT